MSAVLFYFSATGNSLKVAKDLARSLGDATLIPIARALKDNIKQQFDVVGIVFPVYMFGVPRIISDFLKNIKIKPGTYIFSVATFGGLPGKPHTFISRILKKNNLKLDAGFSVRMPGNYTPLYGAIAKEKQDEMFIEEERRIKFISESVLSKKCRIIEEKPFIANLLFHYLLYRVSIAQVPLSGKNFWITDSCTGCGLCDKVCPVENIELIEGKPKWLNHCQHCMACLQWCPVEAIQYNKATVGRKRYHHPAINVQDIIGQR